MNQDRFLTNGAPIPPAPFAVLPLRTGVLLPGMTMSFGVSRERSSSLARTLHPGDIIGTLFQKNARTVNPTRQDVFPIGCFARVVQVGRQNGHYRLVLEGMDRFLLGELFEEGPFWRASGELVPDEVKDLVELELLVKAVRERLGELAGDSGAFLQSLDTSELPASRFADFLAASLPLENEQAIRVLETVDATERLRLVSELIAQKKVVTELKSKIDADVRKQFGKAQRETILREQLRAIKRELGEEGDTDEASKLRAQIDAADLPAEVREVADRELKRFEATAGQGPEANVIRTYLSWILAMPWNQSSEPRLDLDAIATKLDEDHYGLEDVKKRILEHMAVQKLSGNPRGTILCLVGPPGVGKTSLGQSIADATDRKFVRIALGGVRDEAEIRGHRRTYVGALPGRLVHALKKVGVKNPVVLLDEVDKLSTGYGGSPEAALLEVLDPEQNKTFTDHYLEVPFDLSEVLFICTANALDNLSAPLRDRLEIVELSGYTNAEKQNIARRYLIPKRLKEIQSTEAALRISDDALEAIISGYTREAGVRQLDREIRRVVRSIALDVARQETGKNVSVVVEKDDLRSMIGKQRFHSEVAERTSVPGVATGLAWTPFGGDVLFIETSRMPGRGKLEITGMLGDVMKESARAALSYVRSHPELLRTGDAELEHHDLHIHVPAGAVPKDGPSAGVTIFTALASLLSDRRVRSDTAMTGECTLRGRVLPVGGIKAKVLAAHRAGIRRVILPKQNERDLDDVPADIRAELEIIFADDMKDVLIHALEEPKLGTPTVTAESMLIPSQDNVLLC